MKKHKIYEDLIGMAWSDKISFEEIKKKTGVLEKEVINIMRKTLKKKSYIFKHSKNTHQIQEYLLHHQMKS